MEPFGTKPKVESKVESKVVTPSCWNKEASASKMEVAEGIDVDPIGVTKLSDGTIIDNVTGEVLYSPNTPANSMTLGEKLEYVFDCKMEVSDLEEKIKKIKENYAKLEYEILEEMQEKDLEKIECSRGSATSKTEPYPNIGNHIDFFNWVAETKSFEFLEKRCSKVAIKDMLAREGLLPPGINTYLKTSLSVRKKAVRRNK